MPTPLRQLSRADFDLRDGASVNTDHSKNSRARRENIQNTQPTPPPPTPQPPSDAQTKAYHTNSQLNNNESVTKSLCADRISCHRLTGTACVVKPRSVYALTRHLGECAPRLMSLHHHAPDSDRQPKSTHETSHYRRHAPTPLLSPPSLCHSPARVDDARGLEEPKDAPNHE